MAQATERIRVQHSFHAHAQEYDRHACVQKRVVGKLAHLVAAGGGAPGRVLDVGTGTGALVTALAPLLAGARFTGLDLAFGMCRTARDQGVEAVISGDAEALPFRADSFDLVVSASVFQWLASPVTAFAEALRVLRPGGTLRFALFGEATLCELRTAYRRAYASLGLGEEQRTRSFHSCAEVGTALAEAGFSAPEVWSEREVLAYPDVAALLRAVRGVGAGATAPPATRGLAERRVMLTMMDLYSREYGTQEGIPATYEVIYGVGTKRG
jgi:malonyl-CoA O-methyltransferase